MTTSCGENSKAKFESDWPTSVYKNYTVTQQSTITIILQLVFYWIDIEFL